MNRTAAIERIVMEVLEDGQLHSTREFTDKINEMDPELLPNVNKLSAVLYQMKNKKNLIETPENRMYCLKTKKEILEGGNIGEELWKLWNEFLEKNIDYKKPNYEMDTVSFERGKKIYEINKKIEAVLKEY